MAVNTTLASIRKYCRFGVIDREREEKAIRGYCKQLEVKTSSLDKEVQYLSGGNQQKVIVGKWLDTDSEIIIFDEPTRGIDVGTKHEIYAIINRLADEGHAILMVSSEFEELMGRGPTGSLSWRRGNWSAVWKRQILTRKSCWTWPPANA